MDTICYSETSLSEPHFIVTQVTLFFFNSTVYAEKALRKAHMYPSPHIIYETEVILQSEQKEIWRKTDEMERGTGHFVSGAC
jgi:hypothetical protein